MFLITAVVLVLLSWESQVMGLNIDCGTRGLGVGFQGGHRELRCVCSSSLGGDSLDKMLKPFLGLS